MSSSDGGYVIQELDKHHDDDRTDDDQDEAADQHRQQTVVWIDPRLKLLFYRRIVLLWLSHGLVSCEKIGTRPMKEQRACVGGCDAVYPAQLIQ